MTLISLICFLALTSSALGRSTYGSYTFEEPKARTILPVQQPVTSGYSSGYGSRVEEKMFMAPRTMLPATPVTIPEVKQPTEAELQCRGKQPGLIILVDSGRRWITCLEDGFAAEQACARGLYFNLESGRCERRPGQLENPCLSSPCLNNGQCVAIDSSSFECRCAPGFDGHLCELDAHVCQTQNPCGSAPGTRCQSFRFGAALPYICIHNHELGYGFSAQQVTPSPCKDIDGTQSLAITDRGFLMCDGERMFIESCPGGTIWDNSNKACVWPDMQDFFGNSHPIESNTGYSKDTIISKPVLTYTETTTVPRVIESIPSFPETTLPPRVFETVPTYGETTIPTRPSEFFNNVETTTFRPRFIEQVSSYGQSMPTVPKSRTFEPLSNFGQMMPRTFPKVDVRMSMPKSGY